MQLLMKGKLCFAVLCRLLSRWFCFYLLSFIFHARTRHAHHHSCFSTAGFKIDEENETVRMNVMAKELKEREQAFQQQQKKLKNSHKHEIEKHEQQMRQLEQKLLKDKVRQTFRCLFFSIF